MNIQTIQHKYKIIVCIANNFTSRPGAECLILEPKANTSFGWSGGWNSWHEVILTVGQRKLWQGSTNIKRVEILTIPPSRYAVRHPLICGILYQPGNRTCSQEAVARIALGCVQPPVQQTDLAASVQNTSRFWSQNLQTEQSDWHSTHDMEPVWISCSREFHFHHIGFASTWDRFSWHINSLRNLFCSFFLFFPTAACAFSNLVTMYQDDFRRPRMACTKHEIVQAVNLRPKTRTNSESDVPVHSRDQVGVMHILNKYLGSGNGVVTNRASQSNDQHLCFRLDQGVTRFSGPCVAWGFWETDLQTCQSSVRSGSPPLMR